MSGEAKPQASSYKPQAPGYKPRNQCPEACGLQLVACSSRGRGGGRWAERRQRQKTAIHTASGLLHEGLLYCLSSFGVLTVVDMAKGEVVYQRRLDLDIFMPYNGAGNLKGGATASPTLAGRVRPWESSRHKLQAASYTPRPRKSLQSSA